MLLNLKPVRLFSLDPARDDQHSEYFIYFQQTKFQYPLFWMVFKFRSRLNTKLYKQLMVFASCKSAYNPVIICPALNFLAA